MTAFRQALAAFPAVVIAAAGAGIGAQAPAADGGLAGTSWQLVRFQGGDDTSLTPDDRSKYTIAFTADGNVSARIDCNRGRGTWKSSGPGLIQFGPMALTRAMCPPQSLHDRIVKHWEHLRSYVIRDGHLFLSLMADGGIYEFEPLRAAKPAAPRSPVVSTGPVTFACTAPGGGSETVTATFYQTRPALVLVERGGQARPAFQVRAASGSRYEGQGLLFWEARGEAQLEWEGVPLKCSKQ